MITFLCGCRSRMEIPLPGTPEQQAQYFKTLDSVSIDAEGFIQCTIHHQRRVGWRAPSHTGKVPPGITDLQYERMSVWGDFPKAPKIEISPSSMPDLRPHIYEGMLDERAVQAIRNAAVGRSDSPVRAGQISAPYCDLATDSSHSSANGLNG